MRSLILTALVSLLSLAATAATPSTAVLDVQNMSCSLCPLTVRKSLEKVPGVSAVKVDMAAKTATVQFDADKVSPQALTQATADAGFPSSVHR